MIYLIILATLLSICRSFSVLLQPFHSTPHVRLCNVHRDCQQLLLVLDTGSPDLWLSDSSCDNCPQRSVRCLSTSNFKSQGNEPSQQLTPREIHYGVGWVKGYEIDYKICGIVTRVLCVTNARDVMHYRSHGVIGIGGNSTGKEFMLKLMKSLNVSNAISLFFGTYFTELTVGGLNEEYVKEGSELDFFETSPEWTMKINSIEVDNVTLGDNILAMVDTGSSLLVFPEAIFQQILLRVQERLSNRCVAKPHGIECPCVSPVSVGLFPDLQIQVKEVSGKSKKFTLKPHSYVQFAHHKCTAEIVSLKLKAFDKILILGNPFMRQYITMFDFERQLIGLVESDKDRIRRSETNNLVVISVFMLVSILAASKAGLHIILKRQQRDGKLII